MKRFRVRETYKVSGWTYVKARSKEDAAAAFEAGVNPIWHFETDVFEDFIDIDWTTLEDCTPEERTK